MNNMVESVNKMSILHIHIRGILIMDIVNYSVALITSYYMLDEVVKRMFTPSADVAFTNTNINILSGVLCISMVGAILFSIILL